MLVPGGGLVPGIFVETGWVRLGLATRQADEEDKKCKPN